jgi:hypothetical protein
MMTPRKLLGLAVTERSIAAVEVGVVHGGRKVLHAAEFPLPEGDPAQAPTALGKALRQFLRQNHFSAGRCIIGIEAKWLIAKEKSLPPTSPDLLAGALSIATEREFASESKDLTFDYSGPVVDSAQGQSVLLVAVPRRNVDHLLATAKAAGLTVTAVTSSTMALASATRGPASPRRLVLHLSPAAAELSVQSSGGFRLLRRLPIALPVSAAAGSSPADGWLNDLAGELRRVVALLPGSQMPQPAPDLHIWNASGLPAAAFSDLGKRLSLEVRLCTYPSDLGIADAPAEPAGGSAAAAALAIVGFSRQMLAVDFLHSRLDPRKKVALRKKVAWGAGLAALVLLLGLALFLDWRKDEQDVQDLKDQLAGMKESLATAKDMVDKAAFARGWYDRRPKHLDCLRELTLAFPAEGRIWATSLALGEDSRALLSGKAADEGAVLEVLDRLSKNPQFRDVKPLYIREVGGGVQGVSFAVSLSYAGSEHP